MHREEDRIGVARGFFRSSCARVPFRLIRERFKLLRTPRVAEDDGMSGPCEQRSELAAHQTRTQDANSHGPVLRDATRA